MDREKVIKSVYDARRYLEDREWIDKSVGVHIDALNDALAILKEQEPVKPVQHFVYTTKGWFCGACDGRLNRLGKYCGFCGREVKWQ